MGILLCVIAASVFGQDAQDPPRRAARYLDLQAEQWTADNGCYSCHNQGDAARAIFRAARHQLVPSPRALWDEWLARPARWDLPEADGPDSDQRLADLQFALAAREAADILKPDSREALTAAARRAARHISADGSWPADPTSSLGSPVTYGKVLGTVLLRDLLKHVGPAEFQDEITRCETWLRNQRPASVTEMAAWTYAFRDSTEPRERRRVRELLRQLRSAQNRDGGFGPYPNSGSEPFDTALVLLATSGLPAAQRDEHLAMARKARQYLLDTQLDQGGWRETTRPAGRESYAQHISTTAWCLLALLETEFLTAESVE